jgi:hypothetical protein
VDVEAPAGTNRAGVSEAGAREFQLPGLHRYHRRCKGANAENSKEVGLLKMLTDIVREATACLVKHPQ